MGKCLYFKPEWVALKTLCETLYKIDGCGAGGLLHIVLDDNNIENRHIHYCLDQCAKNYYKPEANLGMLICYELLKMPMNERKVFDWYRCGSTLDCCGNCKECEYLED